MSPRWTRDERFIVVAYEAGMALNDVNAVLDRYVIGEKSGITAKGVNAICNLLEQANFIKKIGKTEMRLTKNGEDLALRLRSE